MAADTKQSISEMETAFAEHEDGNLFVQLAEAYRAAGDLDRAMRVLRLGLENHPTYVPGFVLLGVVLRELGRDAEAVVCFEQLLEMDPTNPVARASLAEIAQVLARGRGNRNGRVNGAPVSGGGPAGPVPRAPAAAGGDLRTADRTGSWAEPPARSAPPRSGWSAAARPPRPHGDPLRSLVSDVTGGTDRPAGALPGSAMPSGAMPGGTERAHAGDGGAGGAAAAAVESTAVELADRLVGLLEYRDPFFRGGTSMTRLLAAAVAREQGLDEETVNAIALGAVLRDLGQVPLRALIDKSGTELGVDGRRKLERHVDIGIELLDGVSLPAVTLDTIRHHHEWWDGTGYPDGLRADEIPLGARIVAVADSFAAMIAARPHRLPMRVPDAITGIRSRSEKQYDPAVVETLVQLLSNTDWRGLPFGLRHRVLVVDPDDTRAMVTATKLCSNGYLAETAFSAAAARERLLHTRIVGLVVSAELPEAGDGTLLREFREGEQDGMIPVIVSHADAGQRVALLEAGADVCLTPDSGFAELKASLEAFLRREGRLVASGDQPEVPWSGLQGDIKDFPLGWLLQVLNYDSRTAAVFLAGRGDAGAIYLERGHPRHAQTLWLRGEDALRAMLKWSTGSFSVDPDATTNEHTIRTSLMTLLLDDAVQDDHAEFFGAVKV